MAGGIAGIGFDLDRLVNSALVPVTIYCTSRLAPMRDGFFNNVAPGGQSYPQTLENLAGEALLNDVDVTLGPDLLLEPVDGEGSPLLEGAAVVVYDSNGDQLGAVALIGLPQPASALRALLVLWGLNCPSHSLVTV